MTAWASAVGRALQNRWRTPQPSDGTRGCDMSARLDRVWKRVVFGLLAIVAVNGAAPARAADPVPVLVVDGDGHGHGVGMAQDGAYWMGRAGRTTEQIVGHFYPGVAFGRAGGPIRVVVLIDDDADT